MHFLFQYQKNSKKTPNNRAYQQLLKKRSPQRLSSIYNQSKQPKKDQKKEEEVQHLTRLRNETQRLNLLSNQRKVNSSLFAQQKKHINDTAFNKNHTSSSDAFYPSKVKKVNQNETKEIPVSFSSYINKNKSKLASKRGNSFNLRYFDLDEVAKQLASPMKLENKINLEEQKIKKRKNKLINLNNFHSCLMDLQKDNTRYQGNQKPKVHSHGIRTQQNPQKSPYSIKKQISQYDGKSLWRRSIPLNTNKVYQNLIPWTENQQQLSPLRLKGRVRTKAIEYSEAQIFKMNQ